MRAYVYACVCVYVYVCVFACMYARVYVRVCGARVYARVRLFEETCRSTVITIPVPVLTELCYALLYKIKLITFANLF